MQLSLQTSLSRLQSSIELYNADCCSRTFVNWVDVWSLKPIRSIDKQVYGEEAPLQFAQTFSVGFFAASMLYFL